MNIYRYKLNIQLFAEHEDDEEIIVDDDNLDGEVLNDDEEDPHHGSGHSSSHSSGGIHTALEGDYWEKFLALVKMQNEKVEESNQKLHRQLEALSTKLEDLDRRHAAVPASVRQEIENLFQAHVEAGRVNDEGDVKPEKKSKWSRH